MVQLLQKLDFTDNEIQLYQYFLKNPDKTAAEASRLLKMDKSSAYRACEDLEKRGLLISSPKTRGTTFVASSPEILKDIYKNKLEEIAAYQNDINYLIEFLKKQANKQGRETLIKVEYGLDAHIAAMEDSIKSNKDKFILEKWYMKNLIFANSDYNKYVYDFADRRIKAGIRDYYLADSGLSNDFSKLMHTSESLLKEVRIYPVDANSQNSFRVYKDTVEIISFDDQNDYIIVTIKDRFIVELLTTMFWFIWNRSEVRQ